MTVKPTRVRLGRISPFRQQSRSLSLVCLLALSPFACKPDTAKLSSGDEDSKGGTTGKGGSSGADAGAGGEDVGGTTSSGGTSSVTSTSSAGSPTGGQGGVGTTGGAGGSGGTTSTIPGAAAVAEVVDVGLTYSGQPTEMSLVTVGSQQFAAYWNGDTSPDKFKYLTVSSRVLGSKTWKTVTLGAQITSDAHHSIAMAADKQGYIHLSGGMHNVALKYWRTATPMDPTTFQKLDSMIGSEESSCTYPQFFVGPLGDLVFAYRYGSSGQGDTYFNYFDASGGFWNRLLNTKLIDGEGANSAYIVGPIKGPDDYWHLVWTWRGTADANTNHDLSYARTKNFRDWENAAGAKLTVPIKLSAADIVDPIPVGGGLINNNTKVGFDSQQRPIVVYHKYDSEGNTQLFNARFENGAWVQHQTSSWDKRWDIAGYNTLDFMIEVDGVKTYPNGQLKQLYYHAGYTGWGGFILNETTLAATQSIAPPFPYPAELATRESSDVNMRVHWAADSGAGPDPDIYYMMRWETLPPNGDQTRSPEPASTMLRVYGFKRSEMNKLN
jgi:hypothetical protein